MRKIALITGGSRGIGKGIALSLAKLGFGIAIVGTRDYEMVADSIRDLESQSEEFIYIKGNIANEADRNNIVETCVNKYARIDILVNNAGVAPRVRMDILETTEESLDYVMNINMKGTFFLTQKVANHMLEQKQLEDYKTKIVNISSISAYTSSVMRAEYCMSKAATSMVTKLFAHRLAESDISIFEIRPGIIETDMTSTVKDKYDKLFEQGLTPIRRWGQPEDVANAVEAIARGLLDYSTGEVINVDGGFHIHRL